LYNIILIIPARSGSKGVPDKNINQLGGFPLILWSIEACKKSKMINQVMVSTDSLEYKKLSEDCGAYAPFLRSAAISKDSSMDIEFLKYQINVNPQAKEIIFNKE
tara:strand:- start:211 stop:525 length:315 start_codon:yes stop_codon:yes gene_type:complete